MILYVYNLALLVLLVAGLPWWVFRVLFTRKYREGVWARLGFVPRRLRRTADARPAIWLHAVSVGEVLAVSRLVAELDRALPGHRLLISTTTRTGQALPYPKHVQNKRRLLRMLVGEFLEEFLRPSGGSASSSGHRVDGSPRAQREDRPRPRCHPREEWDRR